MSRRRFFNDPTSRLAIREDDRLQEVLAELSPRERGVIELPYGLRSDVSPRTLDEIVREYGVAHRQWGAWPLVEAASGVRILCSWPLVWAVLRQVLGRVEAVVR
ncbi:hypothetical protein GCM10010411_81700 [Actinomadura fulvescens]|uniref:Uncharacterized protein n=1 Tax=Actinomadura fulvescens TaxID=46160 RepID=A0ABP6D0U2_9ACTN